MTGKDSPRTYPHEYRRRRSYEGVTGELQWRVRRVAGGRDGERMSALRPHLRNAFSVSSHMLLLVCDRFPGLRREGQGWLGQERVAGRLDAGGCDGVEDP